MTFEEVRQLPQTEYERYKAWIVWNNEEVQRANERDMRRMR